jgi:competence protein ComGC
MNVKALSNPVTRSRGITLVEILLILSLLAILLSFAMPSVGNATARAELKASVENVQYSVSAARNVARMTESSIALNIQSSPADKVQRITFSRPEKAGESRGRRVGLRIPLREVSVLSTMAHVFDPRPGGRGTDFAGVGGGRIDFLRVDVE